MNKFIRAILVISTIALLSACNTPPTSSTGAPDVKFKPPTQISLTAVQENLGMNREIDDLGFAEKSFNTCDIPATANSGDGCEDKIFAVINLRLMCRDSEGTVTSVSLAPISNRSLSWSLGNRYGTVKTDEEGFAQIRGLFDRPQRGNRIRLTAKEHFLVMRAGEVQRIVTPLEWCKYAN